MEVKDIVGKKVAIWCDTEEKANDFIAKVRDFTKTYQGNNWYEQYKENTAYTVHESSYTFSEKKWYKENAYEIISYNDFFGITEQVESDTKDELSTVEVLEWLYKHCYDRLYKQVFGEDSGIDDIVSLLGAKEVIHRINAYERKNRITTVSDDEITTLLDEKYGIGKWVRE